MIHRYKKKINFMRRKKNQFKKFKQKKKHGNLTYGKKNKTFN